jgi:hypothetical protein
MSQSKRPEPAASAPAERNAPIWVKAFVLFHLLAITIWAFPNPPVAVQQGKAQPAGTDWLEVWDKKYLMPSPPVQDYLLISGFWQYWDMFAPDPVQQDVWCDAVVTFKNGTSSVYAYPRIYSLPLHLKYIKERYRKFYERVSDPNYAYLWGQFGQRIALECDRDPSNPPVAVALRKHVLPIAPPGAPQQKDYSVFQYYTYTVDQRRLAEDKARGL